MARNLDISWQAESEIAKPSQTADFPVTSEHARNASLKCLSAVCRQRRKRQREASSASDAKKHLGCKSEIAKFEVGTHWFEASSSNLAGQGRMKRQEIWLQSVAAVEHSVSLLITRKEDGGQEGEEG